jgi:hypothetical protein
LPGFHCQDFIAGIPENPGFQCWDSVSSSI